MVGWLNCLCSIVKEDEYVSIKLRGLPFRANVADILNFFENYSIIEDSVRIVLNNDGRASGIATVCFSSEKEAKRAQEEMQGRNIGHRYIELSLSTY